MVLDQTTDVTPLSGYRFSHAISLGSNRYVGTVFRRLGLEYWSGPFDWMFASQASAGSDFLHDRYRKPAIWQESVEYKQTFGGAYRLADFAHYDPTSDDGRTHDERGIDRFRSMLRSDEPKFFLFVVQIHAHERDRYVCEFDALTHAITSRTVDATVVGVTIASMGEAPGFVEARRIGGSALFHYNAASLMGGTEFKDPEDDARIDRFMRAWTAP